MENLTNYILDAKISLLEETLNFYFSGIVLLVCFRCDGKGKIKNEFGIMEKCESCQKPDMSFEKADKESDFDADY